MFGMTLLEQLGGEAELRKVVARFVDRMFDDLMIGYLFRMAKREHITEMEYEFAARHLGAPVRFSGPPPETRAPHHMTLGEFDRRTKLLGDTLTEMGVPPHVRGCWIQQIYTLRHQILSKSGTERALASSAEQEPLEPDEEPERRESETGSG
jgi:truncated hemoglobin YjbI